MFWGVCRGCSYPVNQSKVLGQAITPAGKRQILVRAAGHNSKPSEAVWCCPAKPRAAIHKEGSYGKKKPHRIQPAQPRSHPGRLPKPENAQAHKQIQGLKRQCSNAPATHHALSEKE